MASNCSSDSESCLKIDFNVCCCQYRPQGDVPDCDSHTKSKEGCEDKGSHRPCSKGPDDQRACTPSGKSKLGASGCLCPYESLEKENEKNNRCFSSSDGKESKKNDCLVLESANTLRLKTCDIPRPGNCEVLIEMKCVCISESDVSYWLHGRFNDSDMKEPIILGHEGCGHVVKVGPGVSVLKKGDRVAIEPGKPCWSCSKCFSGRHNLCPNSKFCGTPPTNGMLCNYFVHSEKYCHKLPDNVGFEEAALIEPLSIAFHACTRGNVRMGKTVLILGSGALGLLTLMVCRAMGAASVYVVDTIKSRLERARMLGASGIICVESGQCIKEMKKMVEKAVKTKPDISIVCCSMENCTKLSLLITETGGKVVLARADHSEIKVPLFNVATREVDVIGVFRYANSYPKALAALKNGKMNLRHLITHCFKLDDAAKAFDLLKDSQNNAIRVLIECK